MSTPQPSPKKRARQDSSLLTCLTELSDEPLSPVDLPPGHLTIMPPCGDPLCRSTICEEAPRVTVHAFLIGSYWETTLEQQVEDTVWTAPYSRGYASLRHCYEFRHLQGGNEEDCQYDIFFPAEDEWKTYVPQQDIAVQLPGFILLRHHHILESRCKDIEDLKKLAKKLYNTRRIRERWEL
ncbi:hypothetical protein CPB83DRAFT_837579 [Crepidotus variabilis]|uniref:Uncharacterized protein n=1 Tax=Crepidotus variabilis TaxID=179855 RepID=A0A9P6EBV2_9AGAR|nr:hypothetical protein CPB83DRAFT_837579 [Crepidotus variabilis]